MISSKTHSMSVIKKSNNVALVEITEDDAPSQRDARFYVVSYSANEGQVYSIVPADCPGGGRWFGGFNVSGVSYVANGRTRTTAMRWYRRLVAS